MQPGDLYDASYDRELATAIHTKGWTWRTLARHAHAHLAAANRIARQHATTHTAKAPRQTKGTAPALTVRQREALAHLVTAGIHAGAAHMMRTVDGSLAPRVTAASLRTIRTRVEAQAQDPRYLQALHSQVHALPDERTATDRRHDAPPTAPPTPPQAVSQV